ncbi:MAG: lipopolysaccharide biosynthesis protein [Cytophagales bacterium]|nr:lipopolysaccharide biosynthesis protein [Cytophagales bacterium]
MQSKISLLAKETVLYGLGTIVPRMLNFLLVPLHTYVFDREQYGAVTKLYAFVGFVNIVYMFGMETAFFRFVNKPESTPRRIFDLAQSAVLTVSLPLTILLLVFAAPIASYMGVGSHPEFIRWIAFIMLLDAAVAIPFARLRQDKKGFSFAMAKVINVVILIGVTYYFLKIAYDPAIGIGYVFLANLLANGFFIVFFIRTLLAWRPAYDPQLSPAMVRYAYPVMLTGAAGMTNEMFSRLTLDWWLPETFYPNLTSKEAGGVFGACYKYAVFMNLGIQAFRFAAEPFFFSNAKEKNSPALFAKVNHYFIIIGCLFLLAVGINMDLLKYFIAPTYWTGLHIVPILLLAYLFLGVYYNTSVWFKVTDNTHYGTWITAGGAVVTIAANYLLIPVMGYTGSAWAAFGCYLFMMVACYAAGQRHYPIPYRMIPGISYILGTTGLVYAVNSIEIHDQVIASGLHLLVLLAFTAFIFLTERKSFARD